MIHTYSWYSLMIPKFNFDSKRKAYEEEEVDSMEGGFSEDMDEKDEFKNFVRNMLKGLHDISANIIQSGQETIEFLAKQLGVKRGETSNIGSQCEERKIIGGSIFSRTGPQNKPLEYKDEHKLQP